MRWRAFLSIACTGVMLCMARPALADSEGSETEIKAAIVFHAMQFVQWPAARLNQDEPLVLCLSEGAGVTQAIARYEGKRIHGSPLSVKLIKRYTDHLNTCHAVMVEAGDPYELLRISAAARHQALLVIGEGDQALENGAGIGLSLVGSRVAIDVNLGLLRGVGLSVSSKLLRLARTVIE